MKKCTGCDRTDDKPLGINKDGKQYLACCPDNNYREMTAMEELQIRLFDVGTKTKPITLDEMNGFIEKEKQQIIAAFNEGYRDSEIDIGITNNHKDISMFANADYYYNRILQIKR
jgi:hypothetical protein